MFVDIDPVTRNIDPAKVEAAITSRTVGIVPVHLYGLSADMKALSEIAKKHKLWMVEDNAQGIDGHGPGWKQGELSDAVATSFIIQKNLGTFGDGGALYTNREDIDKTVRRLRNHGSLKRSVHTFGFNSRLDDLHAAVLSVKLKHITRWTDRRREIAARYTKGLQGHQLHPAGRAGRLPPRLPPLRHRDPQAGRAGEVPGQRRHRRQAALPHRHPPAGGLPLGQAGRRQPERADCRRRTPPSACRCRCSPS